MFTCILTFILLLPAALLPCLLYSFFSSSELNEMGVVLEEGKMVELRPNTDIPCTPLSACI